MPAPSKASFRFFQYLAHNPDAAKQAGISPSQAAEYVSHNTGSMSYKNLPEKKRISKTLSKMKKRRK